ncbi:hypothetical protein COSO111634_37890 [Corallococcus soli]
MPLRRSSVSSRLRSGPRTYSIRMYATPSVTPTSKVCTTLGCVRRALARASAKSMSTNSGFSANCARIFFITTYFSKPFAPCCLARNTSAMPPCPSRRMICTRALWAWRSVGELCFIDAGSMFVEPNRYWLSARCSSASMSSSARSVSVRRASNPWNCVSAGARAVPPQTGHTRSRLPLLRRASRYSAAWMRWWYTCPQLRQSHGSHSVASLTGSVLAERASSPSMGGGTRESTTWAPCAATSSTCSKRASASGSAFVTWQQSNATRPSRPAASRRTLRSPLRVEASVMKVMSSWTIFRCEESSDDSDGVLARR